MMWLAALVGLVVAVAVLGPLFLAMLFRRLGRVEAELQRVRGRLEQLEHGRLDPRALAPAPPADLPAAATAEPPAPEPAPLVASLAMPRARRTLDPGRAEDLIGSVWFQNLGAVLILVGAFFLILWGYTTGRFGPGVLVAAGVAVGLAIAWRGDRLVRALPGFGQALIGLGFGVVYLSLFLSHFTLRVLAPWPAFLLLVLTSFATLLAGLRHRVQTIAALGVLGAFLPQFLAGLLPLHGFSMTPAGMLGYLAAVNALVFALAARAGWSGLDLGALLLSSAMWVFTFGRDGWGWPVTIGLAALFTGLGLAPLPRLARIEGRVRATDLAVIALAPLAFVASAWPVLAVATPWQVAILLALLAAAYLAAALWVDTRRPERDLWRPLTGAATLFLTAALQRAVGTTHTPMAWTLEGVLLVWLGLGRGGGWLRACGHVVTGLAAVWLLAELVFGGPHAWWRTVRDLVCVLVLLFGAARLHARRATLAPAERFAPELWLAVASLCLMVWSNREANALAQALEGPGGRWHARPELEAPPGGLRQEALAAAFTGAAWFVQAVLSLRFGLRGRGFLRVAGHVIAGFAALALLNTLLGRDGWGRDLPPLVHPPALITLLVLAGAVAVAVHLARAHGAGPLATRTAAHGWGAVVAVLLMAWLAREADHVARTLAGVPGPYARTLARASAESLRQARMLGPVLTSAGWLAEAVAALVAGWISGSTFLRWLGLGLAGLTAIKFVLADLATADPFWRFLTAILLGSVLLAVSFAYQRRRRGREVS